MGSVMTPREMLIQFNLVVFRRKWLILVVFLLVMAAICTYIYLQYPLHKATALILVHENPRQQLILFHDIASPAQPNVQVNPAKNLIEISRSTELAREIVQQYGLDKRVARRAEAPESVREVVRYWYHAALDVPIDVLRWIGILKDSGPKYEYDAIRLLLDERQDIENVAGTELVKLSVWEEDPVEATAIANRLAQLLVEKTITLSQTKASSAYTFTKERAAVAGKELAGTEEELTSLKAGENLLGLETQQQLALARIDRARSDRDAIVQQEEGLRVRLTELDRQLKDVPKLIPATTVVAQNPLVKEIKWAEYSAQMELASREAELGEENPQIDALRARASAAGDKLKGEDQTQVESETTAANPLYQDLKSQLVNAEVQLKDCVARRSTLDEQIASLQGQLQTMAEKELTLRRLERKNTTQEELYTNLEKKLAELDVQQLDRLSEFDVRLVDPAYLPPNAGTDWPRWKPHLLMGAAMALVLAVLAALLVNYFDESYDTPWSLERDLGGPVLGCVPRVRSMDRFVLPRNSDATPV